MVSSRRTASGFTRSASISRLIGNKSKYEYKSNVKLSFYENKYQSIKAAAVAASKSSTVIENEESVKTKKKSVKIVGTAGGNQQGNMELSLQEEILKDAKLLQRQLEKQGYEVHLSSSGVEKKSAGVEKKKSTNSQDIKATVVGRIHLSIRTPPPAVKVEVKEEPKVEIVKLEPKVEIVKLEPKIEIVKYEPKIEEIKVKRVEIRDPAPVKKVVRTMEVLTPVVTKTTRTVVVPSTTTQVKSSVVSSSSKKTVVTTRTFVTTTSKVVKSG